MNIIINPSMPKMKIKIINNAIPKATEFIKAKYPHICFCTVPIIFSASRHGSNFWHEPIRVNISTHGELHLYEKVTVGKTTPKGGLLIGTEIQIICSLIHELTHFVQLTEKRVASEVETTKNEIEYLQKNEPFWYGRLIEV